jgi:hypothetical protein
MLVEQGTTVATVEWQKAAEYQRLAGTDVPQSAVGAMDLLLPRGSGCMFDLLMSLG